MSFLRRILGFGASRREAAGQPPAPPPASAAVPVLVVGDAPPAKVGAAVAPPLTAQDRDTLIRTLYGEARGESEAGQAAVVHVIRNRVLARRSSAHLECTRAWQFSCWNANDPNLGRLLALRDDHPDYQRLAVVVDRAWVTPDTVSGARHYYNPKEASPRWAAPPGRRVAIIGAHHFWADVP